MGGLDTSEGVLSEDPVGLLTQDEADRGLVSLVAEHVVNDVAVEVHLPGILRFERSPLDLDDDVAAQAQLVEEQVSAIPRSA